VSLLAALLLLDTRGRHEASNVLAVRFVVLEKGLPKGATGNGRDGTLLPVAEEGGLGAPAREVAQRVLSLPSVDRLVRPVQLRPRLLCDHRPCLLLSLPPAEDRQPLPSHLPPIPNRRVRGVARAEERRGEERREKERRRGEEKEKERRRGEEGRGERERGKPPSKEGGRQQ